MTSVVLCLSLAAFVAAENVYMLTDNGDLNVRVARDGGASMVRQESVDFFDLEDRVRNLETGSVPLLNTETANLASEATMMANSNVAAPINNRLAVLEGRLNGMQNSLPAVISNTVAAGIRDVKNMMDSKLSYLDSAIAANQSALAALIDDDVMELAHRANASKPKGLVIGYKECATTRANGADSNNYVFMTCTYTKKRADTILYLQLNSNGRQIHSRTNWRFYVDNQPCQGPANQGQGDLRTAWHGSGYDLHRPQTIAGSCFRRGGQNLPAGNRAIKWMQYEHHGDSYIGWSSSSRIRIQEFMPDTDMWQID